MARKKQVRESFPVMDKIELFDLQRRVVSHMTSKSWMNIPHVTYLYEPDITDFFGEYKSLSREMNNKSQKLSFNTLMLRVITEGLKSAPELNALITYKHKKGEGSIKTCESVNICNPWLLADGRMITPVIKNAQDMSLSDIAAAMDTLSDKISNTNVDELLYRAVAADTISELKKLHFGVLIRILATKISFHRVSGLRGKARREYEKIPASGRLTESELIDGTVTVSNIGSLYKGQTGCFGLLEIIPPQVFAIGLGAAQKKPGVYTVAENASKPGNDAALTAGEERIGIRTTLPMCLAFDHRAADFNALVPFLKRLDEIFAEPGIIRSW